MKIIYQTHPHNEFTVEGMTTEGATVFTGPEVAAIFAQLKALLDSEHLMPDDGKKLFPFEWPQTMAQQIDRFNKYGGGGMKHSSDTHLDEKLFEEKLLAQVADPVDFVLCVQNIGLALNPPAGNDTAEDFPVFQFVLSLLFFS